MKYLFPIKAERDWFINWMALNVQHPGNRCKAVPLHVSIEHGTGRGWLIKVMEELLGDWNCTKTKMSDLVNGQFKEYLDKSLLCSIEEVHEGGAKPYEVNDAIRDILIEDRLAVNVKFGHKGTQRIFTNFFLMSNHTDALVLKEVDRRINVFRCDTEPRSKEEYLKIYKWLNGPSKTEPSEGICALYHALKKKNLEGFDWQRSFNNEARQDMIADAQNPTEQALIEFWEDPPFYAMTRAGILKATAEIVDKMQPIVIRCEKIV